MLTGAAGGIGQATAKLLASGGDTIVGIDKRKIAESPEFKSSYQISIDDEAAVAKVVDDIVRDIWQD